MDFWLQGAGQMMKIDNLAKSLNKMYPKPEACVSRADNRRGPIVNAYIVSFLVFGTCFGVFSFPARHLFSEGPTNTPANEATDFLHERIFWVFICTALWPVMILTGLHSAWILAKRRRKA